MSFLVFLPYNSISRNFFPIRVQAYGSGHVGPGIRVWVYGSGAYMGPHIWVQGYGSGLMGPCRWVLADGSLQMGPNRWVLADGTWVPGLGSKSNV